MVVRKGRLKPPGSFKGLYGVFGERIVGGWLADGESFRSMYIGSHDDMEFVWRRQHQKARLLYGDTQEFNRIFRAARARRWTRKRQLAVVRYSYVTMVEYMGKMLNKAGQEDVPELYQDAYIVAKNAAFLVAAMNKIDLDSDKSTYRQIFSEAKVGPPNFERDSLIASGLASSRRERKEVVAASRRLLRWARQELFGSFEPAGRQDPGFWQPVREMRY